MTPVLRRLLLPALLFLIWVPAASAWSWPVQGPVLQGFSYDEAHPYAAGQHRGLDIGADASGQPVLAPAAGTVSYAGTVPTSGKSVTIETPDGYSVTLTHLGSIAVTKGAAVAEEDVVGTIGPSGTPDFDQPYVHLGIRVTADANGYLDPLAFLPLLTAPAPADSSTSSDAAAPPDAAMPGDASVPEPSDPASSGAPSPDPSTPTATGDYAVVPDSTEVTTDDTADSDDGSDGTQTSSDPPSAEPAPQPAPEGSQDPVDTSVPEATVAPGPTPVSTVLPSTPIELPTSTPLRPVDHAPGRPGGPPAPPALPRAHAPLPARVPIEAPRVSPPVAVPTHVAPALPAHHAPLPSPSQRQAPQPLQLALVAGPGVVAVAAAVAAALGGLRRKVAANAVVEAVVIHLPRRRADGAEEVARRRAA